MQNNTNLKAIASMSLEAYKAKFGSSIKIIPSQKNPDTVFFACGYLPDGTPNYGAVGEKAQVILKGQGTPSEKAAKLRVTVYEIHDRETGELKQLPIIQADNQANVLMEL